MKEVVPVRGRPASMTWSFGPGRGAGAWLPTAGMRQEAIVKYRRVNEARWINDQMQIPLISYQLTKLP